MSRIRYKRQYPNSVPNNWTECYKLPLHLDDYCLYAWDVDGNMALSAFNLVYDEHDDLATGEEQRIAHIIDIINGECPTDYEAKWTTGDDVTEIYYKGEFQFLVRGWGHLTGCGGLNLPKNLAAKMQDGFIAYILDKLNGSNGVKWAFLRIVMEDIKVSKFVLENILNTLIVVKFYRRDKSETCLDRCIAKNINQLNKLLTGEKITGLEGLNK